MTSLGRAIIGRTMLMLVAVGVLATVGVYQTALFEADQFMDDYMRQFADESGQAATHIDASRDLVEAEDRFEEIDWADGTLSFATSRAPKVVGPPADTGFGRLRSGDEDWRTFVTKRGTSVRMMAQRMEARRELAEHAAIEISLVIAATMFVVWLIVTVTVRRTMRHFIQMGTGIASRSADASDPLPLENLPYEIGPLVGAMNVLIERQREALRQQRTFIADSAHELRTPLTALHIQIENLKSVEGFSSYAATTALQEGILRASTMLNQLLRMARFDADTRAAVLEQVDLADVLKQCIAEVVEIAEVGGVDVGLAQCDGATARAVRSDVQVLLANILDNAVAYTPRGGSVDCLLRRSSDAVVLEIVDTGPGVRPDDLPRLFDRFFRSASLDKTGSGLGLAIVKAIADRHGLRVTIENRADRAGLRVSIRFPIEHGRVAV